MWTALSNRSTHGAAPVLIVPYVWIGDFVRCHSVVTLLRAAAPERPVDILSSTLCAPLVDYMSGIRRTIVIDLPRGRIALSRQRALAAQLRAEHYGQALMMSRTWKSALAPFLAGIPLRTGFAGELRFGLLNDLRWGERKLPRMIDRMGALALPKGATLPNEWPLPELVVPKDEIDAWRERRRLAAAARPIVTLSPGAVGIGKAWPVGHYAELTRALTADGASVWVLGGPNESPLAAHHCRGGRQPRARSHRRRFAHRDSRARHRRRCRDQRFRSDACGRRYRHADGRDFRAHQSVAPEAAQSARCCHRTTGR